MPKPRVSAAGGFAALAYTFRKGREAGGMYKLYKRMRSRNAWKTCAYRMGGPRGGSGHERGSFPEGGDIPLQQPTTGTTGPPVSTTHRSSRYPASDGPAS